MTMKAGYAIVNGVLVIEGNVEYLVPPAFDDPFRRVLVCTRTGVIAIPCSLIPVHPRPQVME